MQIEDFSITPLQTVIPAYVYEQYADDSDVQAFFAAYNTLSQGYLDWFNSSPLGVYTASAISGDLLDWIGQGVYGIARPVISSQTTAILAGMGTQPMPTFAMGTLQQTQSGTSQNASDDTYKRVLTWILYKQDGIQMSVQWLKRRVARFLFGANGADVSLDYLPDVSVTQPTLGPIGAMGTVAMGTTSMPLLTTRSTAAVNALQINVAATSTSQEFLSLLDQGYLPLPFQITFKVNLT